MDVLVGVGMMTNNRLLRRTREIDKKGDGEASRRRRDEAFLQEILDYNPPVNNDVWMGQSHYHHMIPIRQQQPSCGGIKKRRRLLPNETDLLVRAFDQSQRPSPEVRDQLAARLKMSNRAIQIWFQNRRAKARRDAAEATKASLAFGPPTPTSSKSTQPVKKKTPMIGEEDRIFQEIFCMPELAWMSPPMVDSSEFIGSNNESNASDDFGTPLTWDEQPTPNNSVLLDWTDQADAWMSQFINSSP